MQVFVQDIKEMIEALGNPSMVHAMVVHMPIVLATLGLPLILLMAFVQRDKHTIRTLALLTYVLLVASAIAGVRTGTEAMEALPPTQPAEVADLVQRHGDMAEWLAWMAGATAVFIILSFAPAPKVRLVTVVLAVLSATVTAGWLSLTAHQGGMLVYKHGAGTPKMEHWGEPTPTETEPDAAQPELDETGLVDDGHTPAIRPIDQDEAAAVSYARDIVPIIEIYCIHCHEGRRPDSDYFMTSAADLIGGGQNFDQNIIPGEPDKSPLVQYIRGILQPQMPRGEEPVPEDDLHTLRLWIAAGAIDDSGSEPE